MEPDLVELDLMEALVDADLVLVNHEKAHQVLSNVW